MFGNLNIIRKLLGAPHELVQESCNLCCKLYCAQAIERHRTQLNDSQMKAILAAVGNLKCDHQSPVERVWGPPGTGKTKVASVLLCIFLELNCRTVCCAPTKVAINQLARCLKKQIEEFLRSGSSREDECCSYGNILLFGSKDGINVESDINDIYLNERVERLTECLGLGTGWKKCLSSMIDFLENSVSRYTDSNKVRESDFKALVDFMRTEFRLKANSLRLCMKSLCTHLSRDFLGRKNFDDITNLFHILDMFETFLFQHNLVYEDIKPLMVRDTCDNFVDTSLQLYRISRKCLSALKTLQSSLGELALPNVLNTESVKEFCFQKASLIFCTVSSANKIRSMKMAPLDILVIDEAAQLMECETTIPFQLPGLKKAILFGDEYQLTATLKSKVCEEAGLGRSLFERLSLLGYTKHLLNAQYRMHPEISFFPNLKFYEEQILNAPNVQGQRKPYLSDPMFGPYAFINVGGGGEELDDLTNSRRNMVEVAIVMKIIQNLFKAWTGEALSIGVLSPEAAQVVEIQNKLGRKYEKDEKFLIKVKSIDGFQGGEADIIIISTVRSYASGSMGFLADPHRTNVALTRARYCLWILGNETLMLLNSDSLWCELVHDAKSRHCFFNADEDNDMAKLISHVKKELNELDEFLNEDSISAIWKVVFSTNFRKSFAKLSHSSMKKLVLNLLLKLSRGWRPKRSYGSLFESNSQMVNCFKVHHLYIVCTIDIILEYEYMQVLKVWDILPLKDVQKLVERLDSIFVNYTDHFIGLCKAKCVQGNLEVPRSWETIHDIVRFKDNHHGDGTCRNQIEVSESLLLMKFYAISSDIFRYLVSDRYGRELPLPFELTDEERKVILFGPSTFVLGRSGTGKTTVLITKLFQKEQQFYLASEGCYAAETSKQEAGSFKNPAYEYNRQAKETIIRQLFVTVSPKLCCAVRKHLSYMKSFVAKDGKFSQASNLNDMELMDDDTVFKDIPDSFVGLSTKNYPLVLTFQKFLLMLDGTLSRSFFERFHDIRKAFKGKDISLRSIAVRSFIRKKEVTYDRFRWFYWNHFNTKLTEKLDPSRVYTEIISYIKGGWLVGKSLADKLCLEDYLSLSDSRISTLNIKEREAIYAIFRCYEIMKTERGEFDLADFVTDIHHQLRNETLKGDKMDFIYIDEVQDLTMNQVALFKYICQNVHEGFVFCGDTAQTIAKGTDFRFEDLRTLVYREFFHNAKGTVEKKKKGQISKIYNLRQNFRTHSGVLGLAQSVINLLYYFFPRSIDVLDPETSPIYGEAPVILEPEANANAVVNIFEETKGSNYIVGFGSEQVILVRDDHARMEIINTIAKKALVLTIMECKGLEFHDVLLYNFFSASPLSNEWRVVYEFMKQKDMLDSSSPVSFPSFSLEKHSIMCSELKQLYVAITRTKQRLLIFESKQEFFKPMYDYWMKMSLVQVGKLDVHVKEMQVQCSRKEWNKRGCELYWERNYDMALMCFSRAGNVVWETLSKAASLKEAADRLRDSNFARARDLLRQAAEIYESIGKDKSAAECFFDLGEYERAGKIHLKKFGEFERKNAGMCFYLGRCYEQAAEVYAKGNYYQECLSACTKGKLFKLGLKYLEAWKQHESKRDGTNRMEEDIRTIEQKFLRACANNYYKLKDINSMLNVVRAFSSMDLIRNFLKPLGCLDELLILEEEFGNFLEAAKIARLRGDVIKEADLLGKAGNFSEACSVILLYVLSNSIWEHRKGGWPLKQFIDKEQLLSRAMSFAKAVSEDLFLSICTECDALQHSQTELCEMNHCLIASQKHNSCLGEILSVRKILDALFQFDASKYVFEEEFPADLRQHSEDKVGQNMASVETLMYFWILFKDSILNIVECFGSDEAQRYGKHLDLFDFCLNYFGVRRLSNNSKIIYVLVNPDVDWAKRFNKKYIRNEGKNWVSIKARDFVSAAQNHWPSELLSVSSELLKTLHALYEFSSKNLLPLFCRSKIIIHIFDVAKFLLGSNFIESSSQDTRALKSSIEFCRTYIDFTFPLEWKTPLEENFIFLRMTHLPQKLIEEFVLQSISGGGEVTHGQIGRVVMMWLGSGKPNDSLCGKIIKRFEKNVSWRLFVETLSGNGELESSSSASALNPSSSEHSLVYHFVQALEDTYYTNWRMVEDYMSPSCFLYLIDRLLILASLKMDSVFTTKSSYVEWHIFQQRKGFGACFLSDIGSSLQGSSLRPIFDIMVFMVRDLLFGIQVTKRWIEKSNIDVPTFYPLMILKLVVLLCLVYLNVQQYFDLLSDVLHCGHIICQLPSGFYSALSQLTESTDFCERINMIAEAFKSISDELVILSSKNIASVHEFPEAIFIDRRIARNRSEIMALFFPRNAESKQLTDISPSANESS